MSRTRFTWYNETEELPASDWLLHAVPGVGNVGKLVVDSLVNKHDGKLIARILHPDLPPHATLDSDGLLTPPCLEIHAVTLPCGQDVATLSSNFQPLSPAGQYEVASSLLQASKDAGIGRMLILAGLLAEPGSEEVHVVCASKEDSEAMVGIGIEVSKEHPSAGIIGMTGMVSSLAPTFGQAATCVIAETVGTSVDTVAADRMVAFLNDSFDLNLGLELDNTKETAEKLRAFFDLDEIAELPPDFEKTEPDSQAFYA
ncbi:MAG TPA: PAC2 family protein [Candidatus Thalassarchaeaceae archaeon]|nr:PAC2 family protein [Candidatus Thalassarchaeaceae archaeon]